jgi:hypothetical protein
MVPANLGPDAGKGKGLGKGPGYESPQLAQIPARPSPQQPDYPPQGSRLRHQ